MKRIPNFKVEGLGPVDAIQDGDCVYINLLNGDLELHEDGKRTRCFPEAVEGFCESNLPKQVRNNIFFIVSSRLKRKYHKRRDLLAPNMVGIRESGSSYVYIAEGWHIDIE